MNQVSIIAAFATNQAIWDLIFVVAKRMCFAVDETSNGVKITGFPIPINNFIDYFEGSLKFERAFNAPPVQAIENIFAILDEPAETPLTPSQLQAEALSDLQAIALECDLTIRQHIADDGHLTDKLNKDVRLIRAEARRIVAGFTTWLDRDALRAA